MGPAPATQSDDFPPPVFVLAAPGLPGPTLAAALGMNPDAYGVPELNLPLMATVDIFQREMTGPRGPQIHGTLRALAQILGGEQSLGAVEMARRWIDRRAHLPTADALHEIAARIAPRRMVAPATAVILDAPSLRRLLAAFPKAQFVRLTAHPLHHGQLALAGRAGQIALQLSGALDEDIDPPIPDPQTLWLRVETTLDAELAKLDDKQVTTLKLEDLLADPDEALRGLARKLNLKWNKQAIAAMRQPETSGFAGPGPMGAHINGHIFSFDEIRRDLAGVGEPSLGAPLPWRPDAAGFHEDVTAHAREKGFS